ncbi:hypothetical protein [uncultured Methylobacterium sp.]|uniref:hypothetical protein n=1 Tax=uncultured Methylobacterium sp. TaxID=157278 RepID=UPI0035CC0D61
MGIEHPEIPGPPSLVAEMRETIVETRKAIEAWQVIRDRCTASVADALAEGAIDDIGLLAGIADGLIVAYEYAKADKDPLTLALIEQGMLHVGRRLARAIGPKKAGLICH